MTLLSSKQGQPLLPVADVIDRVEREFGFVRVDSSRGVQFVANRLLKEKPRITHESAEQLLAPLADSVEMIVGDDRHSDTDFLKCYIIPNEPIYIEYVYEGHELQAAGLLQRLQTALNYELLPD